MLVSLQPSPPEFARRVPSPPESRPIHKGNPSVQGLEASGGAATDTLPALSFFFRPLQSGCEPGPRARLCLGIPGEAARSQRLAVECPDHCGAPQSHQICRPIMDCSAPGAAFAAPRRTLLVSAPLAPKRSAAQLKLAHVGKTSLLSHKPSAGEGGSPCCERGSRRFLKPVFAQCRPRSVLIVSSAFPATVRLRL